MSFFIIKLNRADLISLCGLALALAAALLVLSERFNFALGLLLIAMAVDFIDGYVARQLGLTREFGRYLDGFIDVFIYLVAPALFLYQWGLNELYHLPSLVLFVAAGVVRLSVFNVVGNPKNDKGELAYLGMPVFWSLAVLAAAQLGSFVLAREWVIAAVTLVLPVCAVLMVSNRRYYKFNDPKPVSLVLVLCAMGFIALDL